jgi:DNA-binding Lrp family transcriptional regulator
MVESSYHIDALDRELIGVLRRGGRLSNSQLARETAMARGTVQSRLARLVDTGVITGWGPDLNPRATNHPVAAFATLSIAQGSHPRVLASLAKLPEVMEVHVVTGKGDLLCRMAARSNDHLHELIQSIVAIDGVIRSDSQLALQSPIQRTVADLIGG